MPTKKAAPTRTSAKKAAKKSAKKAGGRHARGETVPWKIWVPEHERRSDSKVYKASRKKMNELARTIAKFYYGPVPYEDHHGGGLWLKDDDGWFIVRNLVGMEWSSQYCADPKKVDMLRINAKRLYARFPEAVEGLKDLGIKESLETPIRTDKDVARWTDSICNASLPLPKKLHTGTVPKSGEAVASDEQPTGGFHHYPAPIVDQQLFKYDDFELWVTDENEPVAVVPVGRRGSGDGRTAVVYAAPGTTLAQRKQNAAARGEALILDEDDELSLRAFNNQYTKIYTNNVPEGDPLAKVAKKMAKASEKPRKGVRVRAQRYRP